MATGPPFHRPPGTKRAKKHSASKRPNAYQRGYDAKWRKFSRWYLSQNPVCKTPGCNKPAKHTDHIVAITRGGAKYDESNCQALCHSCHSRKTYLSDGSFGRATNRED